MLHWSWMHYIEFWLSPWGRLFFLVLPIGCGVATSFACIYERRLRSSFRQWLQLTLVAYALAWLVLAALYLPNPAWRYRLLTAGILAGACLLLIAPAVLFLAVTAVYGCAPVDALPFWKRWLLAIALLLLVLRFLSLGVAP